MKEIIKRGLALGLGLAVTSKEQVEKLVEDMVKKGELARDESTEYVSDMVRRGEEVQKELERIIHQKVKEKLEDFNLATKDDIRRLEQRLNQVERQTGSAE